MPSIAAPVAAPTIALSAKRHVEHAVGAELLGEAVGHLEGAAEGADVLAKAEHRLVTTHLRSQRVGDRLEIRHLGHHAASQRDHGASPSPSGSQRSANTPSVAIAGSGIGEASAFSAHSAT